MSETTNIEIANTRDAKTGRFLQGHTGGGRPRGARNKLGEAFIADLRDAWEEHGADVLRRVAQDDPAQLLRVIASLMPRDLNLNLSVDAGEFAGRFRSALELLGNSEPSAPRPPLRSRRTPLVLEHDDDAA